MGNEAFIASLPEQYRALPTFQQYNDMDGLLKSHVNLEQMMGADKNLVFKLPKAGDYTEVYRKLGTPEKPEGYQIPKELKVPLPEPYLKALTAAAHKANITQGQLEALIQFSDGEAFNVMEGGKAAKAKQVADAELAIKTEFGDAYSQRMNLAKDVLEAWGPSGQAALKALSDAGLMNNPAVVGFLSDIGAFAGEDGLVHSAGGGTFSMSKDGALAEIKRLQGDKDFMKGYMTKGDPAHKANNQKMDDLYKIAYPD